MKPVYLTLAAFFFVSVASSQDFEYSFKEEYKMDLPAELSLSSYDGNIEILPSEGNVIQVYYIVKKDVRLMKIDRKELEKEVIVDVDHNMSHLEIRVEPRDKWTSGWRNQPNVHFKVYVPGRTSCDLKTSDGNVALSGLSGSQRIRTSDGNINLSGISGDVIGHTSDGNIQAERIKGSVEVKTSDGDVVLDNLDGRVQSSTSDGNIRISKVKGDIIARTSDGDISFVGVSGSMDAVTSDGNVHGDFALLRNKATIRTSDGNIEVVVPKSLGLDLNIRGKSLHVPLTNFSGHSEDERIEGAVNGGGVDVNLVTSDGRVSLTYR